MLCLLLSDACKVSLPSCKTMMSRLCFKVVPVNVVNHMLIIDLLVLEMFDYDVILGMN